MAELADPNDTEAALETAQSLSMTTTLPDPERLELKPQIRTAAEMPGGV